MLNIKGAYVITGTADPVAVLLSADQDSMYADRIAAVGFDKATAYTFGHKALHALPCTLDCMEFIALNFVGPFQDKVRQLCARIALRQPIGDDTDGGQHAVIDAPKPKPGAPAGAAKRVKSAVQS